MAKKKGAQPPAPAGRANAAANAQQNTDPNAIVDEAALMDLYAKLVDFYTRYKPENLDEDVLTILIQFVIDTGGKSKLNQKLMAKYGEDLNTFDPMSPARALDVHVEESPRPGGPRPPSQPKPKQNTMDKLRKSVSSKGMRPPGDLDRLDTPEQPVEARDLLEAFYSVYDESKLSSDTGVEKFVIWAEKNGLEALSRKLEEKYNHGLLDKEIERLALRRRNLEDTIIAFYAEYDQAKLGTRFTILNIVNWTMKHGLGELNKKFKERYGREIIPVSRPKSGISDLDI